MKRESNIKIRLVAYTDAAGKFTPDAARGGNEDNFFVDVNIDSNAPSQMKQDEILDLSSLGILMVVADGMGGMNAGEVASQIAIDVVRESFVKAKLTESIIATADSRTKYLERVIKSADKAIKLDARNNPKHEGMGSTIIIGWLYNDELTISWCGDSRAYVFNDKTGIRLISRDHSYVQELVNKGVLTYVQTFDHPQNNIVTRSLGDPTKEAKPESKTIKVGKGDIILLCSDGLSGVLRDRKTFDEQGVPFREQNIEDIIRTHTSSMKECRLALWEAAEKEGWYDNVTVILCQIVEGPVSPVLSNDTSSSCSGSTKSGGMLKWLLLIIAVIIAVGTFCFFLGKTTNEIEEESNLDTDVVEKVDSIEQNHDNLISPTETETKKSDNQTENGNESSNYKTDNTDQTITQQIIQQNETKTDKNEETEISELTPITTNKPENREKLSPILKDPNPQTTKKNPLEIQNIENPSSN